MTSEIGENMAEVVEIPYRKIRGTKEWREAQEKLGEAWRTIQASLGERGLIGRTIDNGEITTENTEMLAREDRLSSANLVVMARRMRLAQLLEERGQVTGDVPGAAGGGGGGGGGRGA